MTCGLCYLEEDECCPFCPRDELHRSFIRVRYIPSDPNEPDRLIPVQREWQKRMKTIAALLECEDVPSMNVKSGDAERRVLRYYNPLSPHRPAIETVMSMESGLECSLPVQDL